MTVHCAACQHTWELPMKLPMEIRRAVRAMKGFVAAGCPACGAHGRSVMCGPSQGENLNIPILGSAQVDDVV